MSVLTAPRVPIDLDRDDARDAARRELSDPLYAQFEPSWFERLWRAFGREADRLLDSLSAAGPGGVGGLVVVLALLVALAVAVRLRVGRFARAHASGQAAPVGVSVSARDHRDAAAAASARGDLAEAITERFRAVVAELEERGVLEVHSGRTADEVAAQAGHLLPAHAAPLRQAARLFDDVFYGGKPATEDGYRLVAAVDDAATSARVAQPEEVG